MKTTMILLVSLMGLLANATAQTADSPEKKDSADAVDKAQTADAVSDKKAEAQANVPQSTPKEVAASEANTSAPEPGKGLRFNFRGVPLDMVLNYLSDAAGFIIVLETDVKGKVDVWSNQPLTKDEAVDLLNTVLNQNGYAAIRNGRTLTIVKRDEAKKRDIAVKSGNDPEFLKTDEDVLKARAEFGVTPNLFEKAPDKRPRPQSRETPRPSRTPSTKCSWGSPRMGPPTKRSPSPRSSSP